MNQRKYSKYGVLSTNQIIYELEYDLKVVEDIFKSIDNKNAGRLKSYFEESCTCSLFYHILIYSIVI